jgi:hypothetical protein
MQCPYCRERIKEEAKVCRHCGRELTLFAEHLQKASSLEQEVASLRREVASLKRQISEQRNLSAEHLTAGNLLRSAVIYWKRIAITACLTVLVFVGSNTINLAIDFSGIGQNIQEETFADFLVGFILSYVQQVLAVVFLFSPALLGYIASRRWPGRHSVSYVVFGFLVGLIGMPLQMTLEFSLLHWFQNMTLRTYLNEFVDWVEPVTRFFIAPAILFFSGGWLGDELELRKYPREARPRGIAQRIAEWIPKVESDRIVERIQLLGPILGALIGLITSILGLYAATLQGSS